MNSGIEWKGICKSSGVWIISVLTLIPSLRPLAKHLPDGLFIFALPLYAFFLVVVNGYILLLLKRPPNLGLLRSTVVCGLLLLIITGVNFFLYPIADGLKYQRRGSDQDDAIIKTGQALLAGDNPYHARIYTRVPISTGPGMILLCLPFAGAHRYFLLTPCVLLALCLCIARVTGNIFYAALFIGLLCTSLSFWEIMIVGSDMIAIGFLFSIITILLYSCKPVNRTGAVLLMLFAGIAATVRVIFIGLTPVWAFFIYTKDKRRSFTFLAVALTTAIALHLLFYFLDPHAYTPLHVVRKGGVIMKPLIYAAGLLITICAGVWILLRTRGALSTWVFSLGIACAAPLACVALGDIIRIQGNLSAWQGANYCSVFIPMFYLFYILDFAERRMEEERDESLRIDKQQY